MLPLLRSGGLLAVDNVLMSGAVAEGRSDGHWTEEQIATAREFNRRLLSDPAAGGHAHARGRRRAGGGQAVSTGRRGDAGRRQERGGGPPEDRSACTACRGTGRVFRPWEVRATRSPAPGVGAVATSSPGRDAQAEPAEKAAGSEKADGVETAPKRPKRPAAPKRRTAPADGRPGR